MKYIYLSRADILDSPPIYHSGHDYTTLEAAFNRSYYARALPPVPKECPTPMGTKGETIKIVIEDYVQHLSNYNFRLVFEPELLFGERFQYQNRIMLEFNHLYHWHPLMPNTFNISGKEYAMKDYMFHSELVVKHGLVNVLDSMMSHHNHGPATIPVLRDSILHQRQLRLQSLNNYRKRFNLPAYTSFEELTGETVMAAELKKLYHDIDAVEMYVGMLVEKRRYRGMFGGSITEIGAPFSVKGLMSNYVCSPEQSPIDFVLS
nr:hypothetical protein BaRGS_020826 [Batillaria attramentaria]